MIRLTDKSRVLSKFFCATLALNLLFPLTAMSAPVVSLATAPLANSTTTTVKPNLMFILDTSGSMGFNYLPDWVNDSLCWDGGAYGYNCTNQPPFQSPDFNGVYYNPEIRYQPPVNYDGTDRASQTAWTAVLNNAYSGTATTNLVTSYVDIEWCTNTNYTDCLRNGNYILPGTVNSKSYTTYHKTVSTGTAKIVTGDPANPTITSTSVGPHYYRINPGEYCDSEDLTYCVPTQSTTFSFPAKVRWCDTSTHAAALVPPAGTCQGIHTSNFTNPRFLRGLYSSGAAAASAIAATATISLTTSGCGSSSSSTKKAGIASIDVAGVGNILPSATANERTASSLLSDVTSQSASNGYSFTASGNNLVITAPLSALQGTSVSLTRTSTSNASCTFNLGPVNFSGYTAATAAIPAGNYGSFTRTDIVGTSSTYPRATGRSDCVASSTTCSYTEEMTNFANWWTYYQTRMQTMKTAASRAFKPIDSRYRVGFIDIYGGNYLPIAQFDAGSGNGKDLWYQQLFGAVPTNGTPLRSGLSRVGKIFAGLKPVGTADPMQYSCQQNFALLTTDGYWNTDANTDVTDLSGNQIGDMDGGSTARPQYEGPTATSPTLADVAKYYYDTDLRNSSLNNCTGSLGLDVCANNVFVSNTDSNTKQHMTTFTLGLGVDGQLKYKSDYKNSTSGDYYRLANGLTPIVNWPVPVADQETAVDDLWHAAVNGGGTYFSAKDPNQLATGLNSALSAIQAKLGAGAAAATSTLNPVSGDNSAFVASYTTVKWQGNLEKRLINTTTGEVSTAASWCVEDVVPGSCPAPGNVVVNSTGSSTTYTCVTANLPDVDLPVACTGTMSSTITGSGSSDTRTIKMANASGVLVDFAYNNMTTAQKAYFTGSVLSQWSTLDAATQQPLVTGTNMVNFLRGQYQYEDRSSNTAVNRLFRSRDAVTGDFTESQPAFIGKPTFSYTDAGYSAFVTAQSSRAKTVYIGGNDGMLHAYNAVDGTERWAFVPRAVIPNMWKLSDKNYGSNHTNYVNGAPIISDIYNGSSWRTILVGGLNGGGREFYALDITDPTTPSLLWEIDSTTDNDIGYSFGQPVITKKADGTWVVLLTSGYDNISPGSGDSILFVRNAWTGASISKIATGSGTAASPSGLSRIGTWADKPQQNNLAGYTYGGDLNGNVWRFDINAGTVMKFAVLKDASGNVQPITTEPILGSINSTRVVYIGTGKYLELGDLTDTQKQTVYAIKDDNVTTTIVNPRTVLVQQTITTSGSTRAVTTANPVDFATGLGWYVDLPDSGERVNVNPRLDSGTLFVPTTVPSNTVCLPGGYGWLNFFDYRFGNNGSAAPVSQLFNAPIVGMNILYTTNGQRVVSVVTSSDPTPQTARSDNLTQQGFKGKRVIWRELIP